MAMTYKPKHKLKRRWATVSFYSIIVTLAACLLISMWGNESVAARLNSAQGIIIAILAFLTAIVGGYLGITHHDDISNKDEQ